LGQAPVVIPRQAELGLSNTTKDAKSEQKSQNESLDDIFQFDHTQTTVNLNGAANRMIR
jgi:hypothetical protein